MGPRRLDPPYGGRRKPIEARMPGDPSVILPAMAAAAVVAVVLVLATGGWRAPHPTRAALGWVIGAGAGRTVGVGRGLRGFRADDHALGFGDGWPAGAAVGCGARRRGAGVVPSARRAAWSCADRHWPRRPVRAAGGRPLLCRTHRPP